MLKDDRRLRNPKPDDRTEPLEGLLTLAVVGSFTVLGFRTLFSRFSMLSVEPELFMLTGNTSLWRPLAVVANDSRLLWGGDTRLVDARLEPEVTVLGETSSAAGRSCSTLPPVKKGCSRTVLID